VPAETNEIGGSRFAEDAAPPVLSGGVGPAVLSSLLLAVGALLPVVDGAGRGYSSGALLVALGVLPAALALGFAIRGARVTAAAVVVGVAALAPGRALADAQFLVDPSTTSRPELYLPASLEVPAPGPGLWLLLAGHVVAVAAGVLAFRALSRDAEAAGSDRGGDRRRPVMAVTAGLVAAVGMLMSPFVSSDAYLLAQGAFEGPVLVLVGYLLIAVALPPVIVLTTGSGLGEAARGGLLGLAAAVTAVALPGIVAGFTVPVAGVSGGPVAAVAAAVALVVLALVPGTREDAVRGVPAADDAAGSARLPGSRRLHLVTGGFALLTTALAAGGAAGATVETAGGASDSPTRPWLLVAGVLVGTLGAAMLVPRLATVVRPALAVAWSGVLLAGTSVLDTALTAGQLPGGAVPGPGVLWTVLAMVAALVTAISAGIAGMVERDDADLAGEPTPGRNLATPLVAAGLLTVAGLGLPAVAAPDYVGSGLWSGFGAQPWGLLIVLVVVVAAAALAPRARPARAAALLGGAAAVLALRAAEFPLRGGSAGGGIAASVTTGTWLALAAALAYALAAFLAVSGRLQPPERHTEVSG